MNILEGEFPSVIWVTETEKRQNEKKGEEKLKRRSLANVPEFLESKLVEEQGGLLYYCNPQC